MTYFYTKHNFIIYIKKNYCNYLLYKYTLSVGYLAPGEIFENLLQLKRFGLYFEGILHRSQKIGVMVKYDAKGVILLKQYNALSIF